MHNQHYESQNFDVINYNQLLSEQSVDEHVEQSYKSQMNFNNNLYKSR